MALRRPRVRIPLGPLRATVGVVCHLLESRGTMLKSGNCACGAHKAELACQAIMVTLKE